MNDLWQLHHPKVIDAKEEHGDRDADEFIIASWAALDAGLDLFTRMTADVRRGDGKPLPIGAEAQAGLPRTWCDGEPLGRHSKKPASQLT